MDSVRLPSDVPRSDTPPPPIDLTRQIDALRQVTHRLEAEREEARRRERHLRFVRDLAHRSAGRTDFTEFLHFCAARILELMHLDNCAVFIRATPTQAARTSVARPPAAPPAFFIGDVVTSRILADNQEVRIDDLFQETDMTTAQLRNWHGGAILGLPLAVEETPLGVLFLARPAAPHAFSESEVALAREVASEVAMAVDGARRFEEMNQSARQYERSREEIRGYFHQIGAAMSSALNLDQLLRLIVNLCIRVTHADGGSVYLIEGGRLRQRVVLGPQCGNATAYVRESLLGWGARDGVSSGSVERVAVGDGSGSRKPAVRSFLGVPLVIKDEVKGQINIYRHHDRDFTSDEVALLTTFAGQAALAIENAQMFRFESQRAREATLLYRAARAIALAPDLSDVQRVSVTQMLRVTEADRCMLFLDGDTGTRRHGDYHVAHACGLSNDQLEFFRLLRVNAQQFSPTVWDALSRGRELFLTSPPADSPALSRIFALLPTNACLLVPLLDKERLLGLLYIDDSKLARTYDASQMRIVMTLALQIATAIQRTRLLARQADNLEQLEALQQVSTAVTGSLSLPRVLQMVVEKAGELLNNHSCALLVQMESRGPLHLREVSSTVPRPLADQALQNRIAAECLRRKRPVTFYVGPRRKHGDSEVYEALCRSGLGGYLAVPLMARRKIVGVLNCFANVGHPFDLAAIRLMRSFANQAAGALENARLHEVVKDKLQQLGSLFEVGKAITSTLQLDRVLQTVTENVLEVMEADGCAILLLDERTHTLRLQTSRGLGPHHASRTFSVGRGFIGMAAQTGRPLMLVDEGGDEAPPDSDIISPSPFPEAVRKDGMRSILSVPLTVRGKLIGLINIYDRRIHYHEPGEITLLTTLSSQAAIAIENARLYHEKNQVAQLLRSILMPSEKFEHARVVVGHRFISSQELAGDYYEMFTPSDDRVSLCMADVSGKGPKAAIYAARAKYIVKSYAQGGYTPREVLNMLNRIISAEAEAEMFITLFYAEIDLKRGVLEYASAGHEPAIVWSARHRTTRLLQARDIVIGVDHEWSYRNVRAGMETGDLLVLYTDGVTEARREGTVDGFGLKRLRALVAEHAALAPQALADRITSTVQKFAGRKLNDDFSLMVLRF